jgi:hypothetical protein
MAKAIKLTGNKSVIKQEVENWCKVKTRYAIQLFASCILDGYVFLFMEKGVPLTMYVFLSSLTR